MNTDGTVNNNNAYNSNGVAPDYVKMLESSSQTLTKAIQLRKESLTFSRKGENSAGDIVIVHTILLLSPPAFFDTMYEDAISFKELYKSGKQCFKNIRWKDSTVSYEYNLLKHTYKLRQDLLKGRYRISPYQNFIVHEPKERHITATRLRDRQVQRSLCNNGLYDDITKSFIYDNCACQVGKGIDFALNRLTTHMRRFSLKHGNTGWFLKCDIYHYFENIDHNIAKQVMKKHISDIQMRELVFNIIDSFGEKGIGLGSQISQLIALSVLDEIDHYIKEQLHIKYYIRYMDDFILIHEDKEYLKYCKKQLDLKLEELHLKFNKKTALVPLSHGIKFLKWHFYITDTNKVIRKIDKLKIPKQKRKLKKIYEKEKNGIYPKGTTEESHKCWIANIKRGNTFHQQVRMNKYYKEMAGK